MRQINRKPGFVNYWTGLHGAKRSYTICEAAKSLDVPLVVVTTDVSALNQLKQEIRFFAGDSLEILAFPDWETLPYDQFSPHEDIISERLQTLYRLPNLKQGVVLVSVTTLMHYLPPKTYIETSSFILKLHQELDLIKLRNDLNNRGYYAVDQVVQHGEYAIRGSIIDIFPVGSKLPFRLDLFDNEIDSIRVFDPDSQRSLTELDAINLLPAREFSLNQDSLAVFQDKWQQYFSISAQNSHVYTQVLAGQIVPGLEYYLSLFFERLNSLFDYLPADTIVIRSEELQFSIEKYWQEIEERYEQLRYDISRPILAPKDLFLPQDQLYGGLKRFTQVQIEVDKNIQFPNITIEHKLQQPLTKLAAFLAEHKERILFCTDSEGRQEALLELLKSIQVTPNKYSSWLEFIKGNKKYGICIGQLEQGLFLEDIIIITEAQIFGQQVVLQRRRQRQETQDPDAVIRDLIELHIGDPVVHIEHGVGRYLGLQTITAAGQEAEYLALEYADSAKIYVPIASLHLISRYMGASPENAPLTTLGTKQWETAKRKAAEKVSDVAAELLEIYAMRAAHTGFIFNKPDGYEQFTANFPFETTIDQQNAIDAVIADMISPKAMDRLVCGDVGFGKTEVAMRAAFIAANASKQVVILVPTTLLAQQHYDNFQDRFAAWPVNIALLSRFNTPKQQQEILDKLAAGQVDVVIGTHKLLQDDVKLKDLGLLIVDEEHRFGVKQKEKIKALRANIDILTLTATPIPRTLSMSLAGIRDLSIIATPPAKRLSVKTFLYEYATNVIREAILREIMRGGQVYFLHNDVKTIDKFAATIAELTPEAHIDVAHGQMRERQLEQIMSNFYHGRFNVLVCTTIIESGIDIPTANTIIINRADRFGLAQLHQLRGRVGRSHHQAYAYLLVNSKKSLTKDAQKRLEAIEMIKELGAGFTLATHDLEIRGAGEILGEEQSGQIQAIGYNLYMDFLDSAVNSLKSGKKPELLTSLQSGIEVDLVIPSLIPDAYVFDVDMRLTLYKRIASAKTKTALHELQVEFIDRFGLLPQATKNLFAITELKLQAEKLGVNKIKAGTTKGYVEFIEKPKVEPLTIIKLIQSHPDIYKLSGANRLKFDFGELNTPEDLIGKLALLLQKLIP